MTRERINEISGYLEGYYATDNGDAACEKTTIIEELLVEVEALAEKLAEAYTKANVSVEMSEIN